MAGPVEPQINEIADTLAVKETMIGGKEHMIGHYPGGPDTL